LWRGGEFNVKTIRFGIIGCGNVTEIKSGPAFRKIEGCSLAAVMRRDLAKAADYARRHGVEKYTSDYREIMTDPGIDAVYIATPPQWHCFYTLEAARFGKAVYVEKPMAVTAAECREMIAACKTYGVPLFPAYYRRGQEKFLYAKHLLDSGAIGTVRSFSLNFSCPALAFDPERPWLMDKKAAGGGLLYDVGSHMLDMLLFLLGDVASAYSVSANLGGAYDVNDTHSAVIRFAAGVQGTAQFTFCTARARDELTVTGSAGSISFAIMNSGPITLKGDGGTEEFAFVPPEHVQQPFIERVVRALQGTGSLDTTGTYGLRAQELLEALDKGGIYTREEARAYED
jgi:1,5-anhydro-D-fructose reductase (1,5-anhydro-D-mannitol-forming)